MWLAKLTFLTCTKTKSVAPIWLEIDSLQWFALSLDLPYNSNLTNGEKRFWPTIPLALTIPGRNKWLPCSRYLLALWMENFSNGTDFPAIRCLYSGSRLIQRKSTGVQSFQTTCERRGSATYDGLGEGKRGTFLLSPIPIAQTYVFNYNCITPFKFSFNTSAFASKRRGNLLPSRPKLKGRVQASC